MEKKPRVLRLTLSKPPFEVMVTGEKKIEYRKRSKWLLSRMYNKDGTQKDYDLVEFKNGYGKDKPYFIAEFKGWDAAYKPHTAIFTNGLRVDVEHGDILIHLGQIIETGNLNN